MILQFRLPPDNKTLKVEIEDTMLVSAFIAQLKSMNYLDSDKSYSMRTSAGIVISDTSTFAKHGGSDFVLIENTFADSSTEEFTSPASSSSGQGIKYTVDIIMCIDCTGSMASIIDTVKTNALKFYPDLIKALEAKDKHIDTLRIKVISYRDYYVDGSLAMNESAFFHFPEQQSEFQSTVNSLRATGGGDEPENGLESLALALKSEWNKSGDKRREIVIFWTDASAHPLEKSGKPSHYPTSLPKTFNELSDWWGGDQDGLVSTSAQRLILYAPDSYPWTDISNNWDNVIHYPSKAGYGLKELDYETILSAIVKSV